MKKEYPRWKVVGESVKRTIAEHLQLFQKQHALPILTLSDVECSHDISHVRLFVSCFVHDDEISSSEIIDKLNDNVGEFRKKLAEKSARKKVPNLRFHLDATVDKALAVGALMDADNFLPSEAE